MPTAKIKLNKYKLKVIPLKSRTEEIYVWNLK